MDDASTREIYEAERPQDAIADCKAENARLTARIAELEKALKDVAEAKMPGQARYIARTTLEASGGE
jgi:BMFP domain-containing protein YqiC